MFSILLSAILSLAHAAPSASDQVINSDIGVPGAYEVPVEWEVQAFPNGQTVTLNGTVQAVHEQLLRINPDYDSDFQLHKLESRAGKLVSRTDFSKSRVYCSPSQFGKASVDNLEQGISHLRGLNGRPRNRGGPGACGRVSCSYNTGIWWCNDSKRPKSLRSWGSIADGALRVWTVCAGRLDLGYERGEVSGQAFHSSNWNVIVRENDC